MLSTSIEIAHNISALLFFRSRDNQAFISVFFLAKKTTIEMSMVGENAQRGRKMKYTEREGRKQWNGCSKKDAEKLITDNDVGRLLTQY